MLPLPLAREDEKDVHREQNTYLSEERKEALMKQNPSTITNAGSPVSAAGLQDSSYSSSNF